MANMHVFLFCVLYVVTTASHAIPPPPQANRYSDTVSVVASPRAVYQQAPQQVIQQQHVQYQQQYQKQQNLRQQIVTSAVVPVVKNQKPVKYVQRRKPVQSTSAKKPVAAAVVPLKKQQVTPSKYQYAALQAAKVAYATPVVRYSAPVYATPVPVVYAAPKPVTKSSYKTSNQAAWKTYQKQLQQWQIAVLNGYQPQQDAPQAPAGTPGNFFIQSAYYPQYYPSQYPVYPQPAQPYPQPAQPYPQPIQPYPQPAQPYPQPGQNYPQPLRPYPQPEPVEQPGSSNNLDQYPNNADTIVEAPAESSPTPPESQPGGISSEIPAPEQPQPEYPQPQPQPEYPQPQPQPEYPQQPSEQPSQPEVPQEQVPELVYIPDSGPVQPSEPQPQPYPEQPSQPSEFQPPSEIQPVYPPIGPDPTLPEVDNGVETFPGQPSLVPATAEYPQTTETFTEQTTSAGGLFQYCGSPRGQYPSPNSCSNYINCWDDVAIEQECPAGLVFGESSCDYPQNVDCGDRPITSPVAIVGEGGAPGSNGTSQCPSSFGTFKSNKNCGAFVVCVAWEAYEFSCPGGTNYNDHLKVCDYPYRVDCGDLPPNPNPIQPEEVEGSTEIDQPDNREPTSQPPIVAVDTFTEAPVYPGPEQPTYPAPEQPLYPAPEQPTYPAPEQPLYPAPEYPAPEQPPQPEYPPTGTPVSETTLVAELPPSYFNQYYGYQVKRVPSSTYRSKSFVNTGIRCNTKRVLKLSRNCDAVSICRGGFTHIVNCAPNTAYDTYKQKCIASYKARC